MAQTTQKGDQFMHVPGLSQAGGSRIIEWKTSHSLSGTPIYVCREEEWLSESLEQYLLMSFALKYSSQLPRQCRDQEQYNCYATVRKQYTFNLRAFLFSFVFFR